MVRVTEELALSPETVTVYHASDPLLGHLPVLIFHGASTTSNYTLNSSRVQIHVFSPAGLQSFPRLTISPSSPFYSVVSHLPREFQGDEIYRGLAFGLFKYFSELPEGVRAYLRNAYPIRGRRPGSGPALFGEQHVADLVKAMIKSDNTPSIIESLQTALQTQHVSNIDIDLILPPDAIIPLLPEELEEIPEDEDDIFDPTLRQYGIYKPLVRLFGESVFLPTTRLRRAPSKPTSVNRSRAFTAEQKIELRLKLSELVDTEERYVAKVRELVHNIASQFRESARNKSPDSISPSIQELERLFPESADRILSMNAGFLDELRRVMDDTEEEAIKDMETTTSSLLNPRGLGSVRPKDPSGALAIAKVFLEWFPRFTDCYQSYIKASRHFPTILSKFLDQESSFRQRAHQTGEQAIRSALIEPVQRLPRYSLLIDQIVTCLPITHSALQPMLKARDIITNICSMDDPSTDKPHVASRLRGLVDSWPPDLEPQGRLITAADFVELSPPFDIPLDSTSTAGILLLFGDCVTILKKIGTMGARDLLREIDKPSAAELLISMTNAAGGEASYEFVFTGWHTLADVKFTESANGSLVWMTSMQALKGAHTGEHKVSKPATSRCFLLQESFEGKAAKWGEDVVKARIEARFSEAERENPCWTLRSVRMPDTNLGLHAAVFQEGAAQLIEGRKEPAAVRIVLDHNKGTKGAPVGHYGVEIVVDVNTGSMDNLSMVTVGTNGKQYQDVVAVEDFLRTMAHRVVQLLGAQFHVCNRQLTPAMVSYYSKVLRCLKFTATSARAEKTRSFLTSSPVKLLSNFWGTSGGNTTPDSVVSNTKQPRLPSLHRSNSFHSIQGSIRGRDDRSIADESLSDNSIGRLESSFECYITALQSRKGPNIGKILLNRHGVDELSVNDIYNRLIENPYDFEIASEVGIEIIFVAFENFLTIAWTEQMGPMITMQSLNTLQDRANRRAPGDFADFVSYLFREMAPQNRRAFATVIKLLADLLDGCGDDGDRGALTLAFAELLVTNGAASNYINLLDRLVEDSDRIFASTNVIQESNFGNSITDSLQSTYYKEKSMTGSVTSNASSLRRKWGLDMLTRNKDKEEKPERPSVWRSLSRHRNPATGEQSSLSRATNTFSRAIDDSSLQRRLNQQPISPVRPALADAFENAPRPSSSRLLDFPPGLIDETYHMHGTPKGGRSKRRSSLSDLKTLMAAASLAEESLQPLQATKETSEKLNSVVKPAVTPSKIPVGVNMSPEAKTPRQKENVGEDPFVQGKILVAEPAPAKIPASPMKSASRHSKALSVSSIPTLKTGRGLATEIDLTNRAPNSPTKVVQKLRLQSPQKLRERLQTGNKAAEEAGTALQSELTKLSSQVTELKNKEGTASQAADVRKLVESVKALEDTIPILKLEIEKKQVDLQREFDTTVKTAESKMRAIDQLHREVSAENELLYERFNDELGKIVKALRGKGKDDKEQLMAKLKEQSEETARLKKENSRLKREMVSLKAAMKGHE